MLSCIAITAQNDFVATFLNVLLVSTKGLHACSFEVFELSSAVGSELLLLSADAAAVEALMQAFTALSWLSFLNCENLLPGSPNHNTLNPPASHTLVLLPHTL